MSGSSGVEKGMRERDGIKWVGKRVGYVQRVTYESGTEG